jgi:hypothetical protein
MSAKGVKTPLSLFRTLDIIGKGKSEKANPLKAELLNKIFYIPGKRRRGFLLLLAELETADSVQAVRLRSHALSMFKAFGKTTPAVRFG